jgi:hypothetical protein
MESCPAGIPRIAAISSVTFIAGKIPPLPGLAPWLNLISNVFVGLNDHARYAHHI